MEEKGRRWEDRQKHLGVQGGEWSQWWALGSKLAGEGTGGRERREALRADLAAVAVGPMGESVNHCPADEWLGNPRCVAGSGLPEIEVTRVHRSEHDEACDVMDAGWAAGSWS